MGALVSECGKYRYWLRRGTPGTRVVFVMLNPSTADGDTDDPTVRRCVGFAKSLWCSELIIVNLYAYRATDPRELLKTADPVGPDNRAYLEALIQTTPLVVCAWGCHDKKGEGAKFLELARRLNVRARCFGYTKEGQPKHPLYIAATASLVPFV